MKRPAAQNQESMTHDLRLGWYRRIYSGYIKGRRINSISLGAEAWFWRIVVACDDYGNFDAHPALLFLGTVGLRHDVSQEQVVGWLNEMVDCRLVARFDVNGEQFLHIVGFNARQNTQNGKKTRRFPVCPFESDDKRMLQDYPELSRIHPDPNPDPNPELDQDSCTEPPAAASEPAAADHPFLIFHCVPGRKKGAATWGLSRTFLAELAAAYPAVDVEQAARSARLWVETNPTKRKTADGMEKFIDSWMKREQNGSRNIDRSDVRKPARDYDEIAKRIGGAA